jgi:hypothetical protein
LGALRHADPRLCGVDLNKLAARAEQHHSLAEELRLQWVHAALHGYWYIAAVCAAN